MNKNKLSALILILFLCSGIWGCNSYASYSGDDDLKVIQEKTFKTEPGKTLKLSGSAGDILLTSWDKNEVYVKVLGNEKAKEKVELSFSQENDKIEILAKREGFFLSFSGIQLRFEIKVPAKYNCNLSTSGGDIRFGSVEGRNSLSTSGGDVSVKETKGDLKVETSGGDITINKTWGKLDVSTSGGDIKAEDFSGDISASTSGGNIKLMGQNSKISAETSGGDIVLNYSGENKGIELETSGGDITINLPAGFKASTYLNSSGGDVEVNAPTSNVKKFTSSKFEGELNGSGNKLTAKTSGGEIKVNAK